MIGSEWIQNQRFMLYSNYQGIHWIRIINFV